MERVSQASGSENKRLDTAGQQCKTHGPTRQASRANSRGREALDRGQAGWTGPGLHHTAVCSKPGVTLPVQLARSPRGRQRWKTVGLLKGPLRLGWA